MFQGPCQGWMNALTLWVVSILVGPVRHRHLVSFRAQEAVAALDNLRARSKLNKHFQLIYIGKIVRLS